MSACYYMVVIPELRVHIDLEIVVQMLRFFQHSKNRCPIVVLDAHQSPIR